MRPIVQRFLYARARRRYYQAYERLAARVRCMTLTAEGRCKAAALRIARKRLKREIAKWEGARRG